MKNKCKSISMFFKKYKKSIMIILFVVGLFLVLDILMKERVISNYYKRIIILTCINIIMAVSLNLITGFTGQLCLGHSGFMAIGAYTAAILSVKFQMPFLINLLVAAVFSGFVAMLIGIPTLKLSGDYFAITTLGFCEIIRIIITNIDYLGGPRGMTAIPIKTNFTWAFFIMALVIILVRNLIHSAQGRAMISIRENEIAAEAMGVNAKKYKIISFVIAGALAGLAGGLYSQYVNFIDPKSFGFMKSIDYIIYVVVGGMGSISGSVLSASILTVLPEALRALQDFRLIVYPVILIILMMFRPQGLMGTKEFSIKRLTDLFKKKEREEGDINA